MNIGQTYRRRGMMAAASTLAVVAGIGIVSAAGAAEDVTIYASDVNGNCFATSIDQPCDPSTTPRVTVQTGDTVTWDFTHKAEGQVHNVASENEAAEDANWVNFESGYFVDTATYTFTKPGEYQFVCSVHLTQNMRGVIVVEGAPVEGTPTPTPTATATVTPTATPTFQATPTPTVAISEGDHRDTPAPGAGPRDTTKPRVANASAKRLSVGARLRFWLSEPATVAIKATRKGAKSPSASATIQSPAGTRTYTLRTHALRRGTYTVSLTPVDAMGNAGATIKRTLRVR